MAEETTPNTPETPAPPAAPQFDYDALANQVADKLKDSFKSQPAAPAPRPAPAAPANQDPLAEMLRPYIEPAQRSAALAEEAASDAVEFYGNNPELEKDERTEIEKRFKAMKAAGMPLKREDIYKHYIGDNIDKQVEKRIKRREEAVTRAANAGATVGSGSPDRSPGQVRDARGMSSEELGKALEGASF